MHGARGYWLIGLVLALAACQPASGAIPTLVPTLAPPSTPTLVLPAASPDAPTSESVATQPRETSAPGDTPTPLIAPAPSPTPYTSLSPLIYVPAGEFTMGSPPGTDPLAERWERPAHTIRLAGFWIESMEVSNTRYSLCVAARACTPPQRESSRTRSDYYANPQYGEYPVINVTHVQAQAHCAWAGGRLPTEAEWEYAARFNDGRLYPWGNDLDLGRGNFARGEGSDTEPVNTYQHGASALGVLHLAGNVWEWVADWFAEDYYRVSPEQNPPGPATGTERVARGGAYATDPQFVRAANRFGLDPERGYNNVGFRCVTTQPPRGAYLLPTLTPAP